VKKTPLAKKSTAKPGYPVSIPGLRERNKQQKDRLIRRAARKLFTKKGYEATTLREVAAEADVGFGTVFAYAVDKSGLLAMVYLEELESLPRLFEGLDEKASMLDQLTEGLGRLFYFWGEIPALSRHVLQQMEFFANNPHMEAIIQRRRRSRMELLSWLQAQKTAGRVADEVQLSDAADTLFAIYTSTVREWSITHPTDVATGIARLRTLMALAVRGLERRR
jgi:AcrR family transcriptional regulator